jgi:hypothetical protein
MLNIEKLVTVFGLEGRSSGSRSETRRRLGGVGGGPSEGVGIE